MGTWRGVVLVCSLLVGCNGGTTRGNQGGEPSQDGTPSGGTDTPPSTTPGDSTPGDRTGTPDPGTGTGTGTDPGTGTGSNPDTDDPGQPSGSTRPPLTNAVRLKSFFPTPSGSPAWLEPAPTSLVAFKDKLYFAINTNDYWFTDGHAGLWTSNASVSGTVELKDFPGPSNSPSSVSQLTVAGGKLFFVAQEQTYGSEPWVSDGTSSGTHLVKDITPGPDGSNPTGLSAVGNTLLFFRFVPETPQTPSHTELWKSDGTAAGTVRVKDLGAGSSAGNYRLAIKGALYFSLSDPDHGSELWKSDGTAAGTQLVRDITPGAASSYPSDFQAVGNRLFFLIGQGAGSGSQLWRTDGTQGGTVLVEDLSQNGANPYAELMPAVGSTLYLTLSDYTDQLMRLYALSVSGTGTTQRRLVSTLPNPYSDQQDAAFPILSNFAVAGGKLYFGYFIGSAGPAPRDVQLWVTDGTQGGTQQAMWPLSRSDEFQSDIYSLDDRVLFAGQGATGLEPWVSDGTNAGTRQLQDVNPGTDGSFPRSFMRVGSAVFFVAYDPEHGNSLWVFPPAS